MVAGPSGADGAPMEELEALRCVSTGGTHSILDIKGISPARADGAIYPLARARCSCRSSALRPADPPRRRAVAGAGRPGSQRPVRAVAGVLCHLYKDGEPDEIYIEGASGD